MKKLLATVKWDLTLAVKYNIVAVAILVTIVYTVLFKVFSFNRFDDLLIILIFSDPVMLGFVFIGVLVLFEKGANTLQAVVVTPLKAWQYLWSKTISLTLIAAVCSLVMAIVGHGWKFHYLYLALAVLLSSALFVMIGFIGVARVSTFNQYIIIVPLFLTPMILPFLNFFGVTNTYWFYLIPSQASLILFRAAFKSGSTLEIAYAILYLGMCTALAYSLARKSFEVNIIRSGK